jgi:hypothetical protein
LQEASILLPSGRTVLLNPDVQSGSFDGVESVTTEAEFTQKFPPGDYVFQFQGIGDGLVKAAMKHGAVAFPSVPALANTQAATAIDPDLPFELVFVPTAGMRSNDLAQVVIKDSFGFTVFSTPYWRRDSGALSGTTTNLVIPPATFNFDAAYSCQIRYLAVESVNTDAYTNSARS